MFGLSCQQSRCERFKGNWLPQTTPASSVASLVTQWLIVLLTMKGPLPLDVVDVGTKHMMQVVVMRKCMLTGGRRWKCGQRNQNRSQRNNGHQGLSYVGDVEETRMMSLRATRKLLQWGFLFLIRERQNSAVTVVSDVEEKGIGQAIAMQKLT